MSKRGITDETGFAILLPTQKSVRVSQWEIYILTEGQQS